MNAVYHFGNGSRLFVPAALGLPGDQDNDAAEELIRTLDTSLVGGRPEPVTTAGGAPAPEPDQPARAS
jgi:hypothetical protein